MTFFVHARKRAKRRLGPCQPCALLLATLVAVPAWAAERVELRIAGQRLTVEVAATPAQRAQGLMERPPLAALEGMLFVFAGDDERCLWMRDTPSALAAAFIDASGRILIRSRCSRRPIPGTARGRRRAMRWKPRPAGLRRAGSSRANRYGDWKGWRRHPGERF